MNNTVDLSFLKVQFYAFPYRDDDDALRSVGIDPTKKIEPLFDFGTRRHFTHDFQQQLADLRFPEHDVTEIMKFDSRHHRGMVFVVDDQFSGSMRPCIHSFFHVMREMNVGIFIPEKSVIFSEVFDEDLHRRTMREIMERFEPDTYKLDMMPMRLLRDSLLPQVDPNTHFLDDRLERNRERKLLRERKVAAFKLMPKGGQR